MEGQTTATTAAATNPNVVSGASSNANQGQVENKTTESKDSQKANGESNDGTNGGSKEPQTQEEFEELLMGSNKFKVQKGLLPIIKQWERSIQKKQQEIANSKKQFESMDEETFFKQRGKSAKEWAEELLLKEIEKSQMDPRDLKIKEYEQKIAEKEKQEQEFKKKFEDEQNQQQVNAQYQKASEEFLDAWKGSGLPATQGFGTMVAMELYRTSQLAEQGMIERPLTPKEAADKVKKDWLSHNKSIYSGFSPEQLEEYVGADLLKKWRDYDVGRKLANPNQPSQQKSGPANSAASSKKPQFTEREYKEWNESGLTPSEFLRRRKQNQ